MRPWTSDSVNNRGHGRWDFVNGGFGFQPVELAGTPVGISAERMTGMIPVPRKLTAFWG
jgi:hypothetical protein